MLTFIDYFNFGLFVLFTVLYCYQFYYVLVALAHRPKKLEVEKPVRHHKFAVVIAARNEAAVIAKLIDSIKKQNYPEKLVDVFVVADNSNDDTARIARQAGATVYKRYDATRVGKGYALDFLFKAIRRDFGADAYEGYFVFDADNLLAPDFIAEMNKVFDQGYRVVTSYRNSKNYDSNWISAGYALWFLREAKFLNNPRMILHTSCAISGTGFLVHNDIIQKNDGWKHHLLTEDIEFSISSVLEGETIGYCGAAEVFDEQPQTWKQSWHQRLRWSKGFYQVFGNYGSRLVSGIFKKRNFSCFDMFMTITPMMLLSLAGVVMNGGFLLYGLMSDRMMLSVVEHTVSALGASLFNFYIVLFFVGALTTITEWKKIHCKSYKKIIFTFTFPLFIFTYLPISIVALFKKVKWQPIVHSIAIPVEKCTQNAS